MATPILATFTDELTGEEITRELCKMSEFFTATPERQAEACQRWADERGNDQHNTLLTFVRWERRA